MRLDLSPLESALAQLEEGLVLYDSDIVRQCPEIRGQMSSRRHPGVRVHLRTQRQDD